MIWAGQTAHVIASGPSATSDVIERLRGQNVIVVNATALSAPWAPVWFFQDAAVVFESMRSTVPRVTRDGVDMVEFVKGFAGLVVTTSKRVKAALPEAVELVRAPRMGWFPPPGSPDVRSGRSSGQTAIGLGRAMGAGRIDLHGFDMRVVDGREHHHSEYAGRQRNLAIYQEHFLPAFAGWHSQAMRAGFEILNATPGSALREFPMVESI